MVKEKDAVMVEEVPAPDEEEAPVLLGNTVKVGDKEYNIGKLDAKRIAGVANLIGNMQFKGRKIVESMGVKPTSNDLLWGVLAAMNEDDLTNLGILLLDDADAEYVKDNFDVNWVMEALAILIGKGDLGKVLKNLQLISDMLQF